jgi:predicted ATPase
MNEADYTAGNPRFNGTDLLVVVSGCSGAGKSSLLQEMARRGYCVQPEPGRQVVKEQLFIDGDGLPWQNAVGFIELCVSRAMYFYNTAAPTDKPVLFDRSFLDNIRGFADLGLPVPDSLKEASKRYRYAARVFMTPPWKELFANDAERRHTFEAAEAEYAALLQAYAANGYDIVLIPRGTVAARATFLERQLGY